MDPNKIKAALQVDEAKLQEQMLGRVSKHLGLTSQGRVYLHAQNALRQKDQVALYAVGAKYAQLANMRESDIPEVGEISDALGIDAKVVASRLLDLKNEGKLEAVARGQYRVIFGKVPAILSEIELQGGVTNA